MCRPWGFSFFECSAVGSPTTTRRLLLAEVAERLRCPIARVRTLIRSGMLRAIDTSARAGSLRPRYVVDEADLARFEAARAPAPAPRPARRVTANGIPNYFAEVSHG